VLAAGLAGVELLFGSWLFDSGIELDALNVVQNTRKTYRVDSLYSEGDGLVRYHRDGYGFRGQYSSPDRIDVLTVGGSTTDQRFITDEKTWQEVIRQEFQKDGRQISVVNAGVDGQSTFGHIESFRVWFPRIPNLRPRFILVYAGINDMAAKGASRSYFDKFKARQLSTVDRLKERSALMHLYRVLKWAIQSEPVIATHRKIDFNKVVWVREPKRKYTSEYLEEVRSEYLERLTLLGHLIRTLGAQPIFVTQQIRSVRLMNGELWGADHGPARDFNSLDDYQILSVFNQATMDYCAKTGIPCFDLARELLLEDADFYDFAHNTPQGARKVGRYLKEKLAPLL
jgi:lysophospholipase L1-like esterase